MELFENQRKAYEFCDRSLELETEKIESEKIKIGGGLYTIRIKVYQRDKDNRQHIRTFWPGVFAGQLPEQS
jgi:hypothetical protein